MQTIRSLMLYLMTYTVPRTHTFRIQYTSIQCWNNERQTVICVALSSSFLSSPPYHPHWSRSTSLYSADVLLYWRFSFRFSLFSFWISLVFYIQFLIFICFFRHYFSLHSIFQVCLCQRLRQVYQRPRPKHRHQRRTSWKEVWQTQRYGISEKLRSGRDCSRRFWTLSSWLWSEP